MNINKRDSKGHIMKGNVVSEETKKKISESMKGSQNHFYGKKHTEQTKKKIRDNHPYQNIRGKNHFNWKGGVIRTMNKLALERDNYTCQVCGLDEKEIMQVDHIRPKALFPELATNLDNLMTLCPNDHARKTIKDIKKYNKYKD